jgi:glycerophosphoryl diester phosphodiesterase
LVRTDLSTRRVVDRAGRRGTAVHAWTVNVPAWLPRLLDRGVANVITDDPAALRARLQELRGLDTVDRLLLRVRDELIE